MRIETDRLLMRQFDENDINDAFNYLSNEDTMYYIEEPFSLEKTQKFITPPGHNY